MRAPLVSRRLFLEAAGLLLTTAFQGRAQKRGVIRIGALLPAPTGQNPLVDRVLEAAQMGLTMARDEYSLNAEVVGQHLEVQLLPAPDAQAAIRAAERLLDQGAYALIGGLGENQAEAISQLAEKRRVPFFNVGSSRDSLRNEACGRYTFHVEASAAMYLDALADWFVRSGFRRWFFVYPDSPDGKALHRRAQKALSQRHFGAREVGQAVVAQVRPEFGGALEAIRRARPDVVLLLLDASTQLDFLEAYEAVKLSPAVTGFPYPEAQTRAFFSAARNRAPRAGAGYRAVLWEARLDRYGARELNARFLQRFRRPMEPPAWATYQSVKMLFQAASFGGSPEGPGLMAYLEDPQTVFDVYKGIGVSFRPWDHQLRQSLYLVQVSSDAKDEWNLASLVGELPAIYYPGTDPVERLDQLGDLRRDSHCSLGGGS
ncbi:MAG: ABC transporter substrate-binding protein [Bacillota bacterium]|nr:ABC transporter substrate-binding protein [Bacillota bacterium]